MSALGPLVIEIAARGVSLAALGMLLGLALRRRGPAVGATVSLATLTGLVAAMALAPCPWPRWWTLAPPRAVAAPAPNPPVPTDAKVPDDHPGSSRTAPPEPPESLEGVAPAGRPATIPSASLPAPPPEAPRAVGSRRGWPEWIASAFLAGCAIGLVRLIVGLRSVSGLRRRSRPIDDPRLLDTVESLRGEMGGTRPVEVRASGEVTTPAAIGWRRPALLLPADSWRAWDDDARRAILAHELAHVRRGDYAAGLWAEFCRTLNFYNPLAHGLARRLRLQQELAADAWGARLAGGRRAYLATLARLALRHDERPVGWPARAFLPASDTFLRRIQMLRDTKDLPPARPSMTWRAIALGSLTAAVAILAGLRGPAASPAARAQEAARTPPGATDEPFRLDGVPREAGLVVVLRPAALLTRPEFAPFRTWNGPTSGLKLPMEQVEQLTLVGLTRPGRDEGRGRPMIDLVVVRARAPQEWKALTGELVRTSYAALDDRTIVLGSDPDLQILRTDLARPRAAHAWDEPWNLVKKGDLAIAAETPWLIQALAPPAVQPGGPTGALAAFAPLFDKTYAYAAGIDLADGLTLDAVVSCTSDEGTERVAETLQAARTLARNALQSFRERAQPGSPKERATFEQLIDRANALLDQARVARDGARSVRLRSRADLDAAALAKALLPALDASRAASRRTQSVNHLKQIALAMHNYHDAHGSFPPAVLHGPDGRTPYSWRVALLPYLEQQSLYDQYRFDEPWDGPNNRKLLEQIPEVYRVPGDAGDSTDACYYTLTGPSTIFSGKEGTMVSQITDGTSNTILVVEARRPIPWTRPEDIPYDAAKPVPELGGYFERGFDAAFADGAVRFLSTSIDEQVLRALLTRAGGEVISIP